MMKQYRSILMASAFTIAFLMVSGCDFFRKIAGRPTSSDLDEIREEIRMEKQQQETVALAAQMAGEEEKDTVEYDAKGGMIHKYCVVVGSFSVAQNAEKIMQKLSGAGYRAFTFPFKGLIAVGVDPTDSEEDINASLNRLKTEKFLPKDIFIMTTDK